MIWSLRLQYCKRSGNGHENGLSHYPVSQEKKPLKGPKHWTISLISHISKIMLKVISIDSKMKLKNIWQKSKWDSGQTETQFTSLRKSTCSTRKNIIYTWRTLAFSEALALMRIWFKPFSHCTTPLEVQSSLTITLDSTLRQQLVSTKDTHPHQSYWISTWKTSCERC